MDCLPQLHIAAIHAAPGYRTAVPGIGVLCREDNALLGAGGYQNSNGDFSKYLAVGYQPWRIASTRIGGIAGVVDGYRRGRMFAAGVLLSQATTKGELHLTVFPPGPNNTPLTFQFSITHSFKE